eukprot:gnl/TRDRNA2_/TRDRNA2_199080_c0_seq1.p1 gnl/TRDRNA2_/TRDRNA2_199080_c0~~gnl/TRDRNA2_/TRDRNA2_199080_c0_seq1.p1  ORF type:complete len:111 (-),score=12.08 gnl/TRDRNA2_/TRDRNA2_199080_c0_seq1:225-557(-)
MRRPHHRYVILKSPRLTRPAHVQTMKHHSVCSRILSSSFFVDFLLGRQPDSSFENNNFPDDVSTTSNAPARQEPDGDNFSRTDALLDSTAGASSPKRSCIAADSCVTNRL